MESTNGEGPDGTSLKPVSSLRARFENMGNSPNPNVSKPADIPPPTAPTATGPPSRPISPAPKPNRLRDFKPGQELPPPNTSTPTVPARPKPKPAALSVNQDAPPPPTTSRPVPTPKPQIAHLQQPPATAPLPAVTVLPPQSPPKNRVSALGVGDSSPFVNPDAITAPSTPTGGGRSFKIPSRSLNTSPSANVALSPRPGGSRPPSPPPPRRSGELNRTLNPKIAPPPPAPRNEKALIPAPKSGAVSAATVVHRSNISQENSPFNSPPSSVGSGGDTPPQLPTRPRPQSHIEQSSRPRSVVIGFDPPPVHPTVSSIRKDREEASGLSRGHITPQITGESRPALPARPGNFDIPPRPPPLSNSNNAMPPPPRPQRPAVTTAVKAVDSPPTAPPPKRVVSTPTSQQSQQQLTAPTRAHGRSMTIDRASDRTPAEFRIAPTPIGPPAIASAPPKSIQSTPVVAARVAPQTEPIHHVTTYPEAANTNRRPPFSKHGTYEISTKYDARSFDVCGQFICASGHMTRVWSLIDGEQCMSLQHTEGVKATAVSFKPAADPREEGKRIWIGTNTGDLMEVEVATHAITSSRANVHGRYEVIKIYRHWNEIWTLDESGTLLVWGPDETAVANVAGNPTQSFKVPKGHTHSMVIGDQLWHATGKEIRVFAPTVDGRTQFQVLVRPLVADNAGEVTSGTLVKSHPDMAFFGHVDGKVTIYNTKNFACVTMLNISTWKINSLASAGSYIWAAYNTGKICVYDVEEAPWVILKEWQGHDNPIMKMAADPSSSYFLDRQQIITLGADNKIKIWDGLLEDDFLEDSMKSKDTQYCDFDEVRALFLTWNAGASTPSSLRHSGGDATFFQDLVQSSGSPDVLVFGFQELVDLEDKKLTAKRFLKPKKKEAGTDQERMSHQYRDWRDFLMKTLDDYMPADNLYHLLHTAPMVGLFTCVFVKSHLRDRIRGLQGAEVKRGMGGLHGNKGCVAVRFRIDDTSICLVNCHLAAGQSQANARHNDVAAILEANLFTVERDTAARIDSFVGGGDGSLIMDHELCILNGDLNYRIDTMSRDTVVTAVKQNNLGKLLERDQLLVACRRNPAFKLRAFEEMPITFAPTYKYDVGTDNYDTSEKRRSPAWCDRLLYRGRGRIEQFDYRRHEVRVSDHRPVTGSFNLWVKKVDPRGRATAWMESQQSFEDMREKETSEDKLFFLRDTCGFDEETSKRLIKEKSARRDNRSPVRN
ncbi:inositol polyphosphate 5-phosphatase [Fusarium heterosporum]|uniref:Inositol polyphosphate 5-phosphatase n=1 Tax=Fusarium heterosporum TaxID=42747 RepID=A0A8H5WXT5_FUSHE|nr:inositol polyphosphate 5-phosphatase [Fusarium heterosporum]